MSGSGRWLIFGAFAAVLGIGATVWILGGRGAGSRHAAVPAARILTTTTSIPVDPTTLAGTSAVQAAWVVAENARPGTTDWRIEGTPPGTIAGFADAVYAKAGDTVRLFVSTDASTFVVDAYRIGYYGGTGGRLVWTSAPVTGQVQPTCPVTPVTNMVECSNWAPNLDVTITADFLPGDYLFKLVGDGGQQSYVPLTVWDPTSHAAFMVKNDVYTWQAWNPYGGYDFYAGLGGCPPRVYPPCNRARVVSFDRPYAYGQGAGDFMGSELPLVEFVEQHGLDVTYVTDLNLEQDTALPLAHRVLLSLGHDECWSLNERVAAQSAEQHGVNVIFFAGSPMLRHVRPEPSPLGAYREVVDYRDSASDPMDRLGVPMEVTGNTWGIAPANWTEVPFVGEAYGGYLEPNAPLAPFIVEDASSWLYQGTGVHDGEQIPEVLGTDYDQFSPVSHPTNVEIFGHSPIPEGDAQISRHPAYSDMTYYTDPLSGAGVFDTGINSWIPVMAPCAPTAALCPTQVVDQISLNLLTLFGTGPAGLTQPSAPNWQHFY